MAYIVPNTTIQLLYNIPFDDTYDNSMYFATIAEQNAYFEDTDGNGHYLHIALELNNQSYQRTEKGTLRIGMVVASDPTWSAIKLVYNANYMRFKNTNFENKWFYAFIDKIEYINNNCVEITYHIDVIQTWICEWTFNQCMIERSHTPVDTFGAFTYPENLETGPYMDYEASVLTDGVSSGNSYVYQPKIFLCSVLDNNEDYANGILMPGMGYNNSSARTAMGRMFSGARYYIYDLTTQGVIDLNTKIQTITGSFGSGSKVDAVINMFMFPSDFVPNFGDVEMEAPKKLLTIAVPSTIDGYAPRNKKLLTWPYNVLYMTNNQGGYSEYRWEYFDDMAQPRVIFGVWGNISANPGLLCAPYLYNGCSDYNYEERLTLEGFPMCAWANDAFKAWLAQNGGTIVATGVNTALNWVNALKPERSVKGLIKDKTGAVISAAQQTFSELGKVWDYSVQPPQAHGNANGNLQYQAGLLTFSFFYKQIRREYAQQIDEFFDMYGYKIMRVGRPNMDVRPCYTYVKTIGCSIEANIPCEEKRTIEAIFDKGIRFWRYKRKVTNETVAFGTFTPGINDNSPLQEG